MIKAGDVLLIWNMPYPVASGLIAAFTGAHCDHCATALPTINGDTAIYEAQPPKSRKMPVADYLKQLQEWGNSKIDWRQKVDRWLYCDVWRSKDISTRQLVAMYAEAERWLGTPYSMVMNYLFMRKTIHCSEECGRILQAGGIVQWDKEPSRVTPLDIQDCLTQSGWGQVERLNYRPGAL